jgi:energy-coupling factor transporter ATP-binding protein EcfA2
VRLDCRELTFAYDEGGRPLTAIDHVSFAVDEGTATALLGPSGAGKSTLLQLVRGLMAPAGGEVLLDGLTPADGGYSQAQRRVGIVFQQPEMQLFSTSAAEDVAFGPRQFGFAADEVERAVTESLDLVGLPRARFGERHPYSLSGGEQRRLAIAGVLAMRPRALLLDEPFVSLDPGSRRELAAIFARLRADGMTMVLATHDVDQAWALCDTRVILAAGRVVDAGAWRLGEGGDDLLTANRLRVPVLAELWRRLGRAGSAPRTAAEAAEELAP